MPNGTCHQQSFAAALATGRVVLSASLEPAREAEILLAHATGASRSQLLAFPERLLSNDQWRLFQSLIEKRSLGEPVAYLTGCREFWSLPVRVSDATLIPRPETELLVEQALARIPPEKPISVLDMGTGSGAIALAIASERKTCRVTGSDFSAAALAVAKGNQERLQLENLDWVLGSWYQAVPRRCFGLIVSNPPYVADGDPHLAQGDLTHEPVIALSSGADGLDAIREIVGHAHEHLEKPGWLLLEHGFDQQKAVIELLIAAGFDKVSGHKDLAGIPRAVAGRKIQ